MAKTKTKQRRALAPIPVAAPIVIRETTTAARHGGKHGGKGGRKGHKRPSLEKTVMALALGGLAMGFLDKMTRPDASGKKALDIPTIPVIGKAGTLAVATHFFGKGAPGVVTDVRNAAIVIAAYEWGSTGSIAGDEDEDGAALRRGASAR